MINQELTRLGDRLEELTGRIVPDLENRTQTLYAQVMQHAARTDERDRLEKEYTLQSKELRLRSDEIIRIRQQIEQLENQKSVRR